MKKLRKSLSVLLALCLTLVYLPLMSVSADGALDAVEARIEAFDGKLSVAEPDESVLEEYNAIVSMYKALSADDKEQMDVVLFDKFYHKAIDREKQISIANNPDISSYDKRHLINASEQIVVSLGGLPAYLSEAVTLYNVINDKSVSTDDKVAAFNNASVNARIYAGLYSDSYKMFYNELSSNPTKGFETVVNAVAADMLVAEPFGEAAVEKPSKPYRWDYPGGSDDPDYIADYNAYWEKEIIYQERAAREKNYNAEINLKAMAEVAKTATEYAPVAEFINKFLAAKEDYENNKATAKAVSAVAEYDALDTLTKLFISKLSYTFCNEAVNMGSYFYSENKKAADLYSMCIDIGNSIYVDEFIDLINSIDEPYTRSDIDAAKAAYAKVPSSLTSTIPEDIANKYVAILAAVSFDEPSQDKPDLSGMPKTDIDYPVSAEMTYKTAHNLFTSVLALSGSDSATFSKDIKTKVFSSEFVGTIIKWLYPLLGNASSLVAYSPADLAEKLTEDKYAKAAEKLTAAATRDENGEVVKDLADWENVKFENGDFGFEDGDKEAFVDALSACFRQLSLLPIVIKLENTIGTSDGTYTYGAYEDLVPVFEALDLEGIASSDEYTKLVNDAPFDTKMDARVRSIFVPVANLIEKFADAPVETVLDVLPKLGYVVDSGLLNDQINTLISKVKMIKISPVDLTSQGLYDILDSKLNSLIKEKVLKDENSDVAVDFNNEAFLNLMSSLAGCGEYVVRDSVARGTAYRAGIDSDKAGALVLTWNYIYSVLADKNNSTAIKSVINAVDMNSTLKSVVSAVVSLAPRMNSKFVFKVVVFATAILHFITVVKPYIEDLINTIKV